MTNQKSDLVYYAVKVQNFPGQAEFVAPFESPEKARAIVEAAFPNVRPEAIEIVAVEPRPIA